jgi:hypothetical protein
MIKKISLLTITTLLLISSSFVLAEKDLPIVNGKHWMSSTLQEKRAYMFGIGNILEIEQAMAGDSYKTTNSYSIIPTLLDGLAGISIAELVKQLDQFYRQHPEQNKKTVIEVLYLEMAKPNLKK